MGGVWRSFSRRKKLGLSNWRVTCQYIFLLAFLRGPGAKLGVAAPALIDKFQWPLRTWPVVCARPEP